MILFIYLEDFYPAIGFVRRVARCSNWRLTANLTRMSPSSSPNNKVTFTLNLSPADHLQKIVEVARTGLDILSAKPVGTLWWRRISVTVVGNDEQIAVFRRVFKAYIVREREEE